VSIREQPQGGPCRPRRIVEGEPRASLGLDTQDGARLAEPVPDDQVCPALGQDIQAELRLAFPIQEHQVGAVVPSHPQIHPRFPLAVEQHHRGLYCGKNPIDGVCLSWYKAHTTTCHPALSGCHQEVTNIVRWPWNSPFEPHARAETIHMRDPLTTYLHDHLAGAVFAINLLEALRDQHASEPLGQFAAGLLVEVEADRVVLQRLAAQVDARSNVLKEATAWLGEKISRLKLRRRIAGGLGTFEGLEVLALGILGKLALWRALAVIAAADTRLRGVDFDHLVARAQAQHAQVEEQRLEAARTGLRAVAE
jgi:hypothetical protein